MSAVPRRPAPTRRLFTILLPVALVVLSARGVTAQQWQLAPEVSFTTISTGWPTGDMVLTAIDVLQARNGAYVQLGYGLTLQRHYYLLIPERESAIELFGGYEQLGLTGTDGETLELKRAYARVAFDQVLFGERNRGHRYLMLSLSNVSRWVFPQTAPAELGELSPFFTHAPHARLVFSLADQPDFWRVLGLSGSVGAGVDAGHTAADAPWAFLIGRAELGFSRPIVGSRLYVETDGRARAFLADLTPGVPYPQWYYPDDHTQVSVTGSVDLKSRVLRANPMVPIGLEIGAGIGGSLEAPTVGELDPLGIEPVARVFVDLAVDSSPMFAFRVRAGLSRHVPTGNMAFLFAIQ